jgi:hypothetical protein
MLGILASLINRLCSLGDLFAPHEIVSLVDTADRNKYIEVLDEFDSRYGNTIEKASWFSGQQIRTGFDGTIIKEWNERKYYRDRFEEL